MEPAYLIAGLALVLAAGVVVWALRTAARSRQQADDRSRDDAAANMRVMLEDQISKMAAAQAELAGRIAQMGEQQASQQQALQQAVETRLDSVTHKMGQSLHQTSEKTAKSMGEIQTRLNVIDQAQTNIKELSGQVLGLQDILSNKQARGAFGEIQLADLVSNILPPNAYDFQVTLSNGKRADCVVRMPNPPGPIAIDAKFPLESYHALRTADTDDARKAAQRAFAQDLNKHIKDIATKYILPGETSDSALMFLPSEAVYAELHASFPQVVEASHKARVWIVSPTTMMATLNTVRAILKDVQMRKQAHEIQRQVSLLTDDVGRLQTRIGKLQTHFGQTAKDVDGIVTSAGKINRHIEKVEQIQLGEDVTDADDDIAPDDDHNLLPFSKS